MWFPYKCPGIKTKTTHPELVTTRVLKHQSSTVQWENFEAFIVMLLFTCCWMCLASAREPMTLEREPLLSWHRGCLVDSGVQKLSRFHDSRAQWCWGPLILWSFVGVWANQTSGEVFFETNSKKGPLKMDGWKMTISFWGLVLLASGSCNPLKGDFKPF